MSTSCQKRPHHGGIAEESPGALSVVIPTYNRGALLAETVDACLKHAGGVDLELVIIDDGSTDDTADRLAELAQKHRNIVWRSTPNKGPGHARNLGASLATRPVILFLGDDIQPSTDDFFRVHTHLHTRNPARNFAVLGKVVWPDRPDCDVTFVMSQIQGRGEQQFGYAHLMPHECLDWRFFYTANVSVKRDVVADWTTEGFSDAFHLAAYEDIEFAYRLMRSPGGLTIFYDPTSLGTHHQRHTAETFINRQMSAGLMAQVFYCRHPEVAHDIGIAPYIDELRKPVPPGDDTAVADYLSIIEGVKSWTRILDRQHKMGAEHWHEDLLRGVFELSYAQGFIMAWPEPQANFSGAYRLALHRFSDRVRHVVHREVTGNLFPVDQVLPSFRGAAKVAEARIGGRLRRWARRQPMIVSVYRRVRRYV